MILPAGMRSGRDFRISRGLVTDRYVCRSLILQVSDNGYGFARVGYIVSRKCGGAVSRNRIRRRLRSAAGVIFGLSGLSSYGAKDFVIIGRAWALRCSFTDLLADLGESLGRYEAREVRV